jgi:hypothetical protein
MPSTPIPSKCLEKFADHKEPFYLLGFKHPCVLAQKKKKKKKKRRFINSGS